MGGVRNGKSAGTPEPAAAPQGALQPGAPDVRPTEDASDGVDRLLRSAVRLLREGSATRAFGELASAARGLPITPRLAAALVRFSLLAGTEAAAIALLDSVPAAAAPEVRRAVHRQLARVLRRVGQVPRAIAALEAVLAGQPGDRRARRALQALRAQEVTDGRREAPEEPAPVLGKLPTRKAGVQAPAVWEEEDSGYRVETVVETPTDTQPSVPRERTAVAFPALSPEPESAEPSPESRTRTEIELPAMGALRDTDPDLQALTPEPLARTGTQPPIPGVARGPAASGARPQLEDEPRKTEVELPALGRATDETTGEITSEALPLSPASPVDTQELSTSDLEAALRRAKSSGSAPPSRAEPSRTLEVPWPGAPSRAQGARTEGEAGARAEDAEELARSQKLEAQLIARQAWRELAQLYLKRADRARDANLRAEALTRLAEVMENELQDPAGAARMYREIVELTGDRAALREQVRLLGARGDPSVVRRELDEAIRRARTDRARAGALLTRGERWLHMNELRKAREDFEAANALAPGLLPVLVGLFRCATDAERPAATERLRAALATAPRRSPDRLEGLRVLAQAAEEPQGDPRLAQWAWSEVLAESPGNEQAQAKLLALARRLEDTPALREHLRAQLSREPRGPGARQARLELVASLDARGDEEGALSELRQAVRYEPGHKEAWLLLVERLTARGNMGEAAWALEHAATSMEDERERERTWERLARLWREVLGNPERAQVFARRAESLRQAREEREPPPPPEPPRAAPGAPLVPPPPALVLGTAAIEGLADEVTSNTDPLASPLAGSAEPTVPRAPIPEEPSAAEPESRASQTPAGGRGAPAPARGRKPAPSAGQPARAEKSTADEGLPEGERTGDGASTSLPGAPAARAAAAPASPFAPTPKLERVTPPASAGAAASKGERSALPASSAPAAKGERAASSASTGAAAPSAKAERAASPASTGAPAVIKGERAAPPVSTGAAAVPSAPVAKGAPASTGAAAVPAAKADRAAPSAGAAAVSAPSAPTAKADWAAPLAGAAVASTPSASPAKADRAAPPAATGPSAPPAKPDRAAPPTATAATGPSAPPAKADRAVPPTAAAATGPSVPPAKPDRAAPPTAAAATGPSAPPAKPDRAALPTATAATGPSVPPAKPDRAAPPAAATSPRAERQASGPAAPGGRAQRPGSPSDAAPAVARADKAPASARVAQPASDAEPSLTASRARGAVSPRKPEAPAEGEAPSRSPKAPEPAPGEEDRDLDDEPVPGTRVISWEAPPGRMDPVRRIVRSRQEGPASQGRTFFGKAPAAPEPPVRPGAAETKESPVVSEAPPPSDTEPAALRHIRERPLDPKPYRQLTELFEGQGDTARASLMREIADALEGRESTIPRVQRPPLTAEERAGLRHPGLRTPSGELLAYVGLALCRLFPAQGRAAGALEPLRGSSGPGAPAVLEALNASARLLDVHLPELVLSDDDGPHFTAVHASNPRLLVGRLAVRQALPAPELRFHAGRALLSLSPDLLALRTLKGAQLLRALALLTTVLKDPRASGEEARVVREALSPRALERALVLLEPGTRDFDASALADAARDSANRAGLVACGSVGPAVAALRTRRSHDAELVELLRFAASERYLPLRAPR
jgi:tetratricopeptide (TPR) repeat protein